MALLMPSLQAIRRMRPKPEPGELRLVEALDRCLNDEYEVFFQPLLHVDKPDLVILRRGCGILFIEVKDWDLSCYRVTEEGRMHLRSNGTPKVSPLHQAQSYKDRLIELTIPGLCAQVVKNRALYGMIATAVYCDCSTTSFLKTYFGPMRREGMSTAHCHLIGRDDLTGTGIQRLVEQAHLTSPSRFLDDRLYDEFRRLLRPALHTVEEGVPLHYSREQEPHTHSRPGNRKLFGVVGSGKTTVLAQRAVNALQRTGRPVLILTYNITLRNYIHDRISRVRAEFDWNQFVITHYHLFFKAMADRHNLPVTFNPDDDKEPTSFEDEAFFASVENETERFSTVLIDEVQDYKIEWLRIIRRYFCADPCEYLVVGDEKQRVYDRKLDQRQIATNVGSRPARLTKSVRLRDWQCDLATNYQREFLSARYDADAIGSIRRLDFRPSRKDYTFASADLSVRELASMIQERARAWDVSPNEITVLCPDLRAVRLLEQEFRKFGDCTFVSETCEERKLIEAKYPEDPDRQRNEIRKLRVSRRYNFRRNNGLLKLSTIHSFKGWECSLVVVVIDGSVDEATGAELTYTGFTRAFDDLWLINLGVDKYDEFFRRHLSDPGADIEAVLEAHVDGLRGPANDLKKQPSGDDEEPSYWLPTSDGTF